MEELWTKTENADTWKAWVDHTWDKLDGKLSRTAVKSREKIPYSTVNGVHDDQMTEHPLNWTNGFWGGLMWLMYIGTGREEYLVTAKRAEELMDRAFEQYDELEHDVGFRWHILSGVHYRLTGDLKAKRRNVLAANTLASRFNVDANMIISNNLPDCQNLTIIDTMMNLPLLYWMSEDLKVERFRRVALKHADTTMRDHVRPDGSVIHAVFHDIDTGEALYSIDGQGYAVGSTWSRGQAWAVYGFMISYLHTGKQEYLDTAKRAAHYFISCCCDDYLPKCDFRSPKEPVIYDSTAGAIAACGLIELAKAVPEYEKAMYLEHALKLLQAMEERFCDWSEEEDAVVLMGTERYHGKNGKGIHIPIIYGDYFFAEALLKLRGSDFLPW